MSSLHLQYALPKPNRNELQTFQDRNFGARKGWLTLLLGRLCAFVVIEGVPVPVVCLRWRGPAQTREVDLAAREPWVRAT